MGLLERLRREINAGCASIVGGPQIPQTGFALPPAPHSSSREEELQARIEELEAENAKKDRDLAEHRLKLIEIAGQRNEAKIERDKARRGRNAARRKSRDLQERLAKVVAERDHLEKERWGKIYSCDGA